MINKQLIDYIKSESARGVSAESTKNALLVSGWKEVDIKKAYESLSPSSSTTGGSNKKLILISIVAILIVAGGVLAFMYWPSGETIENTPIVNTAPVLPGDFPPTVAPVDTPVTPPVLSDTDKVTEAVNEICQGYLTNDISIITKYSSAESLNTILDAKVAPTTSCATNSVYQSGINIIANLTIVSPEKTSKELLPISDMIFINENGEWKFNIDLSLKFTANQNKIKILSGDQSGSVDLLVTGIKISPVRPIVNKKDFKITVTIKNNGTKTSDMGTPLMASLLGFENQIPLSGGSYEPLLPGGTTEWVFYPYKYNDLLKISDTPGQKTIQIELNSDKKILEGDYENNIFTQDVQVYAK